MNITVMKFGGTSMGSAATIQQCAGIVSLASEHEVVVAVVSAMQGVTDMLVQSVAQAVAGDHRQINRNVTTLRESHFAVIAGLQAGETRKRIAKAIEDNLAEFGALCHAIAVLGEATPRALDAVVALGERMSMHLLVAAIQASGGQAIAVDSGDFLVTDDHFQHANPDFKASRKMAQKQLLPLLKRGITPVVTGFIGKTLDQVTTTLGRGGSDYSAAIIGNIIDAKKVIIWTDVTGVMSADPRIEPAARTIPKLIYREVAELAYFGAKVLHPKCIRPALEMGAALWVKNTFAPQEHGTEIVPDLQRPPGSIRAVTSIPHLSLITIAGTGMLGIPGLAARAFATTAKSKTNILMISQASSEQSICFLVKEKKAGKVIAMLENEFREELLSRDIDAISGKENVVIITAVGAGMQFTPGVSGQVFSALGQSKINVIAIAQGSSECSISFVVDMPDEKKAVHCIHELINI